MPGLFDEAFVRGDGSATHPLYELSHKTPSGVSLHASPDRGGQAMVKSDTPARVQSASDSVGRPGAT